MEVTLTLFGGQQTRHRKCLIADKSEENITAYSLAVEIKISLWKRGNYRVAVEKLASFSWVFINIAFEYSWTLPTLSTLPLNIAVDWLMKSHENDDQNMNEFHLWRFLRLGMKSCLNTVSYKNQAENSFSRRQN